MLAKKSVRHELFSLIPSTFAITLSRHRKLRQLFTAIYRKHFPDLINLGTVTSPANKQGGHSQDTSDKNYGLMVGPLCNLKLTDQTIDQFMGVSHCWQALLGLLPPDPKTQKALYKTLYKTTDMKTRVTRLIAMDVVRGAICHFYGLGGSAKESRQRAFSLLMSKPFMPKADIGTLGDAVLARQASRSRDRICRIPSLLHIGRARCPLRGDPRSVDLGGHDLARDHRSGAARHAG